MADAEMMEGNILPCAYVVELIKTDPTLNKKWTELYSFKDEIKRLRLRCEDFLAEDHCWNQALKAYEERSWQTDGQTSEMLYKLLIRSYHDKCQNNTADGIIISGDLTALQEKYEGKHSDLIMDLLECLNGERQLLLPGSQVEDMDTMEKDGVLHNVHQLDTLRKELDNHIKCYDPKREKLEELKERLRSLYPSDLFPKPQNGLTFNNQEAIEDTKRQFEECRISKSDTEMQISATLCSIVDNANIVLTELQSEMKHWRMEQKKYYVDVAAKPSMPSKPPLTKWCAHAGQTLFDLIRCSLPNISVDSDPNLTQKMQKINDIFDEMQLCSFVVTDQVKNFIKVSMGTKKKSSDGQDEDDEDSGGNKKFSCPKFKATVRLLAAASIDSVEPVRAYFVHEDSLALVDDPATYDFSKSKYPLKDTKQKGSSNSATVEKGTGTATFKTLELKSFNREKESVVAKEKFRIMFQTKLKVGDRLIKLWTMSLPIVVITGASQQCNACGSLLWQCLNPEDEEQFPPPPCPENLHWSQAKELLDTKLKYLGGRGLNLDEEKHLISRITGNPQANIEEDPVIPFNKFCIVSIYFSFLNRKTVFMLYMILISNHWINITEMKQGVVCLTETHRLMQR
ncbi:Signal transducer and activator of transcription 1-alpha/beta [Mizuhopecten yessoensis]|uniref:Signal transducer and activator of transcription 1-alpha/beta n=1 Tax=Mizuhopecten yessoensis TaxID=6573 RepID=A0A210Q1Q1_MIZYE|nr:Signal transducer and activator of transcription 1-alpha/beta [Mizuhopecten yessoensis]